MVVGELVDWGGGCLLRDSREPVGLLLAEPSEEIEELLLQLLSVVPPPSPASPSRFLRFLLDSRLE